MNRIWSVLAILLFGLGIAILSGGCSDTNPLGAGQDTLLKGETAEGYSPPDDQIQFDGVIETSDAGARMLTFVGLSDTVVAADDCVIVEIVAGVETPLVFEDIAVGDSVHVCGIPQENGYILAHKIRLYSDSDCPDYDLSFRDIIASIDYAAESFTVEGGPETILVDENTIIWGRIGGYQEVSLSNTDGNGENGNIYRFGEAQDIFYEFSDLIVGDVVEVKANIVNTDTLLALSIKLPNCNTKPECVNFEATLASVEISTRIVTFDAMAWIGTVCQGADLTGPEGEPLTLDEFATGDLVAVKGFSTVGDTLQICQMHKVLE
jgi:hypothetical protein